MKAERKPTTLFQAVKDVKVEESNLAATGSLLSSYLRNGSEDAEQIRFWLKVAENSLDALERKESLLEKIKKEVQT